MRQLQAFEIDSVSGGGYISTPFGSFDITSLSTISAVLKGWGDETMATGGAIGAIGLAADAGIFTLPEGIPVTLTGGLVAGLGSLEWLTGAAVGGIAALTNGDYSFSSADIPAGTSFADIPFDFDFGSLF